MTPKDNAVLISAVEYLRHHDRDCWVDWNCIYHHCVPSMHPDSFVNILLTACDDADTNVQMLVCNDDFAASPGPFFKLLPQWYDYLNKLGGYL
ncbi:MAG: hypothetical protein O0X93_01670 [Methanocorpusculum sp.]|nr:hypothetical protein [Methanocorpusculum sp.]MDE2521853.1 hypothetical protein [Methanocorpusculum sp.]MDE2524846.1 hypothetical protein [Methanocorpusculum sp.]